MSALNGDKARFNRQRKAEAREERAQPGIAEEINSIGAEASVRARPVEARHTCSPRRSDGADRASGSCRMTSAAFAPCLAFGSKEEGSLAEVRFQEGETLENALRRFKRKVLQGGNHPRREAARLSSEARPKAAVEAGVGAQAEPEENTQRLRMTEAQ
jgi:hypothetical protein